MTARDLHHQSLPPGLAARLDSVCDQFEAAWRAGERPVLEHFLSQVAVADRAALLRELLALEIDCRRTRGERPAVSEYEPRFPEAKEHLIVLLPATDTPNGPNTTVPPVSATPDGQELSLPGYEILGVLGKGGMGVVYRARHRALKRDVALKMLLTQNHACADERARFKIEAEAAARLQHPNIVQIFEIGEHQGLPYLALEFVEGGSLADQLRHGPLESAQSARLVEALAEAVHLAHSRNVVHRDLKPANVLMSGPANAPLEQLTPKLTDFGLAKRLDEDSGQTRSGAVLGTPSYMAPEQASGESFAVGPAADVYALGAILYACLTGEPPFRGRTVWETLETVRTQPPIAPRRLNGRVPRDLETICLKCLRKEPEKRYPSASELAADLRRWQRGEPVTARPVGRAERVLSWARRRPAIAGLLLAIAFVTALGMGGIAWSVQVALAEAAGRVNAETVRLSEQERLTGVAERAAADARASESEAKRQLLTARTAVYAHQLQQVQELLRRGEFRAAEDLLAVTRSDQRGWEYAHLQALIRKRAMDLGAPWRSDRGGVGVQSAAFHPDGRRFVVVANQGVWLGDWKAGTWEPLAAPADQDGVRGAAFSTDGARLAAVYRFSQPKIDPNPSPLKPERRMGVRTWNLNGEPPSDGVRVPGVSEESELVFSPDLALLAVGGNEKPPPVRVLEAATGLVRHNFKGDGEVLGAIAFSPDGMRLAAGWRGKNAHIWNLATGKEDLTLNSKAASSQQLVFSPDNQQIFTAGDGDIRAYDAATGGLLYRFDPQEHPGPLALSADGRRLLTGGLGVSEYTRVWDLASRRELIRGSLATVSPIAALTPDGSRFLLKDQIHGLRLCAVDPIEGCRVLNGDNFYLQNVAVSRDGHYLATVSHLPRGLAEGANARLWDLRRTKLLWTQPAPLGASAVAFSVDGSRLSVAGNYPQGLAVWETTTGRQLVDSGTREDPSLLHGVTLNDDGTLLASLLEVREATPPYLVQLQRLDPVSGRKKSLNPSAVESPATFHFSPDGKLLAIPRLANRLCLVNTNTGLRGPQFDFDNPIGPLAYHPHDRVIAVAQTIPRQGSIIKLLDLDTGKELVQCNAGRMTIDQLAFNSDGTRLASAGCDFGGTGNGKVAVWEPRAGLQLLVFSAHPTPIAKLLFTAKGELVTAGSGIDRTVKVWEAGPD